ncbi:MAG: polysaccharide deacetylase family protein [Desulfovibrio sp.]|nr:polysaccharide deacetylase family protein [Desulfovibrio sp.]
MKSLRKYLLALLCCCLGVSAANPVAARVVDAGVIIDQPMNENLCALTFDDGPSRFTPQLLDALNDYGIPATFFLVGSMAEKYPYLVRRIVAEGHEVGNHSWSHPNLRMVPRDRKLAEIARTDVLLRSLGAAPLFLRPPYGAFDNSTVEAAGSLGLSIILWSVDTKDWRRLPANYAGLRNGRGQVCPTGALRGIFLFHDTHRATVDDLPRIVGQLRAGGCSRFVTVSEYLDGISDREPSMLMTRRSVRDMQDETPRLRGSMQGTARAVELLQIEIVQSPGPLVPEQQNTPASLQVPVQPPLEDVSPQPGQAPMPSSSARAVSLAFAS